MVPEKAFILAAGFGTRMRPLTDTLPKPLLEVDGQSLLQRNLDQLEAVGVKEVVINTHYLSETFEPHLEGRSSPKIHLSHETEILERAGGIKKVIDFFGNEPFFVLSGDGFWIDPSGENGLEALARAWDPAKMDILLSLTPVEKMKLTQGVGDYDMDQNGSLTRRKDQNGSYMFNSWRINHPRIFDSVPEGHYDYLILMDEAEANQRLYGSVYEGDWHHISTPEDFEAVNEAFAAQKKASA